MFTDSIVSFFHSCNETFLIWLSKNVTDHKPILIIKAIYNIFITSFEIVISFCKKYDKI